GGAVPITAIVCAQTLGVALHGAAPGATWVTTLAVLVVAALVLVNILGVRLGAGVQNATVILKLVTLAALFVVACLLPAGRPPAATATLAPAAIGFSPLFSGVPLTLFAYG